MHKRVLGSGILIILTLSGLAGAAYTDFEKTEYLGKDDLPTVNDALNLNTAISSLTQDITGFGPSAMFMSGDDWAKKADQLSRRNEELKKENKPGMVEQGAFSEFFTNMDLINKANRNAISKYAEDNVNGRNDGKISRRHQNIAENFQRYSGRGSRDADPGWTNAWLSSLEAATEADITNVKAWDERVALLEDLGRHEEAEQVKDEMNSRVGASALGALLALSPFTVIIGVIIACLGIFVVPGRRKVLSAGHLSPFFFKI